MIYAIRIDLRAQRDIDECADWMSSYSEKFMLAQRDRLDRAFGDAIAQTPEAWNFFHITGAPYRAYLFRVGRRTSYWVVYLIDEPARRVNVLRFWNASRDPASFDF